MQLKGASRGLCPWGFAQGLTSIALSAHPMELRVKRDKSQLFLCLHVERDKSAVNSRRWMMEKKMNDEQRSSVKRAKVRRSPVAAHRWIMGFCLR